MNRRFAVAFSALVLASLAPTQSTVEANAARWGMSVVRTIPFDGSALPRIESQPFGTSLRGVFVQADGARILLDVLGKGDGTIGATPHHLFAVGVEDGAVAGLEAEDQTMLVGSLGNGPLLFDGAKVWAPQRPAIEPLVVTPMTDVHPSPDGSRAFVSSVKNRRVTTYLWDLAGNVRRVIAVGDHVGAVAFAADGMLAVARAQFGTAGETSEGISVLDAKGNELANLPAAPAAVKALAFSVDGAELFVLSDNIRRIAWREGQAGRVLAGADTPAMYWAVVDADTALSHDGHVVRLHDARSLQVQKEFAIDAAMPEGMSKANEAKGPVLGVALSPDRRLLAVATWSDLRLYRLAQGKRE